MKNTIVIDATRNCICDLVSAVDNGENRFFIEIRADTALNPKLQIENEQITITGSTFLYEVGTAYYIGDETLQFRIVDDENVGEYFSIEKIAKVDGNLFLTQESNYIPCWMSCNQWEIYQSLPQNDLEVLLLDRHCVLRRVVFWMCYLVK